MSHLSITLEHSYDLDEKATYKYVSKSLNTFMLKSISFTFSSKLVRLKNTSSFIWTYSVFSIHSVTNHKKQSSFTAFFTSSDNSLLMIDWISNKVTLYNLTSASSVYFDLSIDSRSLDKSDLQLIILSL